MGLLETETFELWMSKIMERFDRHEQMLSKLAGKEIKEIPIPGDAILVSITRDTEFIIPHGNTTLLPWDRILCLTQDDTLHLLMDAWGLSGK